MNTAYQEMLRRYAQQRRASLYATTGEAEQLEKELTRVDPMGALAWDRKADARYDAWHGSTAAAAVERLFARPNNVGVLVLPRPATHMGVPEPYNPVPVDRAGAAEEPSGAVHVDQRSGTAPGVAAGCDVEQGSAWSRTGDDAACSPSTDTGV